MDIAAAVLRLSARAVASGLDTVAYIYAPDFGRSGVFEAPEVPEPAFFCECRGREPAKFVAGHVRAG